MQDTATEQQSFKLLKKKFFWVTWAAQSKPTIAGSLPGTVGF